MASQPSPPTHLWMTPSHIATLLDATRHGDHWRARCPVHGGDNPQALSISEGPDQYGHPCTLLYCHAHQCSVEDLCAAMGIPVRNLFCIQPAYARETRNAPRARSPRIDRLKTMEEPTPDEIAQILLEEMIVSDPEWIQTCQPAREKMWQLAQASPRAHHALTRALEHARINPTIFWATLARTMKG